MLLNELLLKRLEPSGVAPDELQALLIRLMNYGVLLREDSQVARDMYDRFVRIEALVSELLTLFGIQLYHDRRFEYVRLYPPGSSMPGMDRSEDHAFGGSLRAGLTQHEVALILVLRAQYDKAVREGRLDERGFATEPLEAIGLAMKNWLSRSLPERATERRAVFRRLRQLRLIEYREEDDLEQAEAWVRVHPMIVDFVSSDAIDALQAEDPVAGPASADTSGSGDSGPHESAADESGSNPSESEGFRPEAEAEVESEAGSEQLELEPEAEPASPRSRRRSSGQEHTHVS